MIKSITNFFKNHLDFKFYPTTIIGLLILILSIPCFFLLPEKFGYENGLLENIQLVLLFTGFGLAIKSNTNKKFFYFVAMVIVILLLREVNCGRTLFFAIPGEVNSFYTWKQIKYGYLAHPLYALYMITVGIYFLKNKLFINLWQYIKNVKFPIYDMSFMIIGFIVGMYAEKNMSCMILEELGELLFYAGLVNFIYLYSRNQNFLIEKN